MQAVLALLVLSLLPRMLACTISETNAAIPLVYVATESYGCTCGLGVVSNCATKAAEINDVTLTLGYGLWNWQRHRTRVHS